MSTPVLQHSCIAAGVMAMFDKGVAVALALQKGGSCLAVFSLTGVRSLAYIPVQSNVLLAISDSLFHERTTVVSNCSIYFHDLVKWIIKETLPPCCTS